MKPNIRRAAFTLVEIIVSLAFVAIIAIAVSVSLQTQVKEAAHLAAVDTVETASNRVLRFLRRDLRRSSFDNVSVIGNDVPPSYLVEAKNGLRIVLFTSINTSNGELVSGGSVVYKVSEQQFFRIESDANDVEISTTVLADFGSDDPVKPALAFRKAENNTIEFKIGVSRVRSKSVNVSGNVKTDKEVRVRSGKISFR